MATLIAGLFLLASLLATRKMCRGFIFNPLVAFFGVWLAALLLYELDRFFRFFYVRLDDYATLLLVLSFALVFIGGVVGMAVARNRVRDTAPNAEQEPFRNLAVLTYAFVGIVIVATLWRYRIVAANYGSLFNHLVSVRQDAFTGALKFPMISRLMSLFGYVAVLNLGVLLAMRWRAIFLALSVLVVVADFVNDATVGMRGSTFNVVLLIVTTFLVSLEVQREPIRPRHLLAAGAVLCGGICLITVILYLRSATAGSLLVFRQRLLVDNYVYLAGTIPSVEVFLHNPWPVNVGGQYTFLPIFQGLDLMIRRALGVAILPDVVQSYYAPITVQGPFNASAYLAYFYSDFGIQGVVVLSLAMGFTACYAFVKATRTRRTLDIQVAAVLLFLMIFTIRGIATTGVSFWTMLAILTIQHVVLRRRWLQDQRPAARIEHGMVSRG